MKKLNIISVCGSGTVTSSMVANKVTELAKKNGYKVNATECNPNGVDGLLSSGSYDLIVFTSPLKGKYDIPTISAIGLLTGMDEEGFEEEFIKVVASFEN